MEATHISSESVRITCIVLPIFTTIIVAVRLYFGVTQQKRFSPEDGWLLFGHVFFIGTALLYYETIPPFFRLTAAGVKAAKEGNTELYATAGDDTILLRKLAFSATVLYWCSLWAAKFSLLWMYKKILVNLTYYLRLWWALVGLCALCWVGCVITLITACGSPMNWFILSECSTPYDTIRTSISLWFGFAVDVTTNLLIMLLPVRLVINLQMPMARKFSIIGLFCLGLICIAAATIRVSQLVQATGQPAVSWLALWGTIETSIAVITTCGPGLYRSARFSSSSRAGQYIQTANSERENRSRAIAKDGGTRVEMKVFPKTMEENPKDGNSSEEELVHRQRVGSVKATTRSPVDKDIHDM